MARIMYMLSVMQTKMTHSKSFALASHFASLIATHEEILDRDDLRADEQQEHTDCLKQCWARIAEIAAAQVK